MDRLPLQKYEEGIVADRWVKICPICRLMFIEKQKNEAPKIYKLDLGGLV